MSIKYMNLVWERSKAKGAALVVMLALADMANDVGECYPGQTKLAAKCRLSRRGLQKTLYALQDEGEIMIQHRRASDTRYLSNTYIITIPCEQSSPPHANRSSLPLRTVVRYPSEPQFATPANYSAQNPLLDPSLNRESDPTPTPRNLILEEIMRRKGGQ